MGRATAKGARSDTVRDLAECEPAEKGDGRKVRGVLDDGGWAETRKRSSLRRPCPPTRILYPPFQIFFPSHDRYSVHVPDAVSPQTSRCRFVFTLRPH